MIIMQGSKFVVTLPEDIVPEQSVMTITLVAQRESSSQVTVEVKAMLLSEYDGYTFHREVQI